ncbi:MAG TPA: hypothetical protein VI136_20315 [Verrucomicrobiae bacterium]
MKTPRQILLARHQAAEPKLDSIRREAVRVAADVNRRTTPIRELTFAATISHGLGLLYRELIWPCRRTWAGLAAAWVALAVFNLTQTEPARPTLAKSKTPPAELQMAFAEQQRLLAELIGPPPQPSPAAPPRRKPAEQPRSERRLELLCS